MHKYKIEDVFIYEWIMYQRLTFPFVALFFNAKRSSNDMSM